MSTASELGIRCSLRELEQVYYVNHNKQPLEDLMRTWKGIQELPHPTRAHLSKGTSAFDTLRERLNSYHPGSSTLVL